MTRICVFCGSSKGARPAYGTAAAALARCLAARGITIVFGGGNTGLMQVLADAMLAAGGEIIGVMPEALIAKERAHSGVADMRITGSMHERKALMAELSDAFIALPGGYGTLEEFCEILTWTQLGLHRKPFGLLNVEGYYNHLLKLFDHAVAERFLSPDHREMVQASTEPDALVERLLHFQVPDTEKFIDLQQT